jgi:UDP-N-acetylglucosamine 3-dehydrogenase
VKLNAAVIGVGNMGRHHARIYHQLTTTKLVAIADPDKSKGEEIAKKYFTKYYPNYKDLLNNEKIDLISIAAPTKFHKEIALACINFGINILIEKPIASTVNEAKQIVQKAKTKGIKFTVGHIERFNPAVLKLKEMIDEDKLGEIVMISTFRMGPTPVQIKDANVIVDIGVHDIDIMNWLFGKLPERVYSRGGKALLKNQEDHVEAFLDYGHGGGMLVANWITPLKVRKLTASGKKAYVELNYITQELDLYESNALLSYDDFGDFLVKFGEDQNKKIIKVKNIEPLKAEIQAFVKCIINNERPCVTAREAIDALAIAQKIAKQIA